jgi:hydroxymethylbilane synthase
MLLGESSSPVKSNRPLILGSRGSKLALVQAHWVRDQIAAAHPEVTIESTVVKTEGDRRHDLPAEAFGREGIFTAELDHALEAHTIDLAVHSLKDLPTRLPDGLTLAAISRREPVEDVLIVREKVALPGSPDDPLASLPRGAKVATSSLRRSAQLKHRRPDLTFVPLRGNLDTRLRKLDQGQADAIIVARAGLKRLGVSLDEGKHRIILLGTDLSLPAAGQGALALETRADDRFAIELARTVHDQATATAVIAERTAMAELGAGCRIPAGFLGRLNGQTLTLQGVVAHPSGEPFYRAEVTVSPADPVEAGKLLAKKLKAQGADQVLKEIRG